MKIKYNKNLEYQTEAINSIVGLFEGGEKFSRRGNFSLNSEFEIISNKLELEEEILKDNLKKIQKENFKGKEDGIVFDENDLKNFSIEMETGTGKTYTYLKTIFELYKKYGLLKFIIVVPSVAIREGVLKTLETTQKHFYNIYSEYVNFQAYEGDTKRKMGILRDFSVSSNIKILVISIQAFNSDNNIINQDRDDSGRMKMIERIAKTKPVLILDEPQNMGSDLSKFALDRLNPLFTLRYSATHKNLYNLVYSLSPFDAYQKGLVKKIEIASVVKENSNEFVFEVQEILVKKGQNPKVKVKVEEKQKEEYVYKTKNFSVGDDIFRKTKNEKYKGKYIEEISVSKNGVEITGGEFFEIAKNEDGVKEDIFRVQIRETIKEHLSRQEEFGENIKVLSLFFIDKVKNYVEDDGIIKNIFEEEFEKLKSKYDFFKNKDVKKIHNGYFASTGKVKKKFTDTGATGEGSKDIYNLIMKDKERLLSFDEETCFIFSHSALKEGWDNPNVFQICTLNETTSKMKKRQEIGRGMRLPLDKNGERIYDKRINKLVVIPNESYKEYVSKLQTEFDESGQKAVTPANSNKKKVVKLKKEAGINLEEFKKLWKKINQKTKYNLKINSKNIVEEVVERVEENLSVGNILIKVERQNISMKDGKVKTIFSSSNVGERNDKKYPIFDFVSRIEEETNLTKKTILSILEKIDNFDVIFDNPEDFTRNIILIIKNILEDELINGIEYIKENDFWDMKLFEDFESYENKMLKVENSVYEHVVHDSFKGEREFAESLDESSNVKIFAKLPSWFVIDTPVGKYNPDWAIVWKENGKEELYLVRETKFYENERLEDVLKKSELQKIICARKHFKEIGADFEVSKKKDLSDLVKK